MHEKEIVRHQLHIVFVVNHAAFFVSHRLPIAKKALLLGHRVGLITGQAGSVAMESDAVEELKAFDIAHSRLAFKSAGVNPILEFLGLIQLVMALRNLKPDLVHCASPKGLLYGGLAARLAGVPSLVLAVSGVGYAGTRAANQGFFRLCIGYVYRTMVRLAYRHPNKRVIVQNGDDKKTILAEGWATTNEVTLLPGSGVDLAKYVGANIETKQLVVLLPARLLIDKGVLEFVEAARALKTYALGWRFVLAGAADYNNPSSISSTQALAWQDEGIVDWLDYVQDMTLLYASASIVCLPSYREGMPKALLEAAAAGCAVVTTDAIGCRDAILPGQTGDLVPPCNSVALASVLLKLINDRPRRERYGRAGREFAIKRFSIDSVVERTLQIYEDMLAHE